VERPALESAERMRGALERGLHGPATFRAALLEVAKTERDAWVNVALGLAEPPEDGAELPRGCVPYLPCGVDALLQTVDAAGVTADDVFVDVGSGAGRAAAVVHLLTGATAIGLEIQAELARAARELSARLQLSRVTTFECDARAPGSAIASGTVFFLYCPFSGEHLTPLLAALELVARTRPLRIACVDVELPERPWLARASFRHAAVALYRSAPAA
jgi:SAM-dependent methyltransferase